MSGSNVLHSAASAGGNVAATHASVDGVLRPIAPFLSDNTNPAGGINSNAEDMAKWMNALLAGGALADGSRLVSEATVRQISTIVTPLMPGLTTAPELAPLRHGFSGYALGLNVRDYRGTRMWHHGGGLPGYVSRVVMLPDLKLGVTVLTNAEAGAVLDSVANHVADHYLGAPAHDWIEAYQSVMARGEAFMAEREKRETAARNSASKPSLPLERYAATYEDAWYGDIAITLEQGKLAMRFTRTPSLVGDLEHWQYDTFVVRWRDRELRADAFVTFALNPDGTIDQAKMRAVSASTDFSFDFQDLLLKPRR
jgi:hypothetical protein